MTTQKKAHNFYVNIEQPISVRRTILESSRLSIHILQGYENLKLLRNEKLELIQEYDKVIKEIISLILKIRSDLPSVPQTKKSKKKITSVKKEELIKQVRIEKVVPKQKSALEALEKELKSIEEQLNHLG
jgi:hypothetical protein